MKENGKSTKERQRRVFTEKVRRSIVKEIEDGMSQAEACRKYNISRSAVYQWMCKYSITVERKTKKVIGNKEDVSSYKGLESELKDAYTQLGKSQLEISFLNKVIEFASKEYGIDLKKSFVMKQSNT